MHKFLIVGHNKDNIELYKYILERHYSGCEVVGFIPENKDIKSIAEWITTAGFSTILLSGRPLANLDISLEKYTIDNGIEIARELRTAGCKAKLILCADNALRKFDKIIANVNEISPELQIVFFDSNLSKTELFKLTDEPITREIQTNIEENNEI